jgi:thioredoxin reductase
MMNITKAEQQVQRADVLVVGGEEPALDEALLVTVVVVDGRRRAMRG